MESISYAELIEAFRDPSSKDVGFWKNVAEIERSIPRYNDRFSWWERAVNFCNASIMEHTVAGSTVSIAGLWPIRLDLNAKDDHESFHPGPGEGHADFYFKPTNEKTDMKAVKSISAGLAKYCGDGTFPHNADSLLFYCLDTGDYFMAMEETPVVELNGYGIYENGLGKRVIYYRVDLPKPKLLGYAKPVSDAEEREILAGLPDYRYIR